MGILLFLLSFTLHAEPVNAMNGLEVAQVHAHPVSYQVHLADIDNRKKTFLIYVPQSLNPRGYEMLDAYLSQGVVVDENGNPRIGVILGDIMRARPSKIHQFNFQFVIKTVRWNDFATETCDARLRDVEENLDFWLKKKRFCPWTTPSMVVKIIKNNQVIWVRPSTSLARYSGSSADASDSLQSSK